MTTTEDVIRLAREAAARHGHTLKDEPEKETVEFITELIALAKAEEREAIKTGIRGLHQKDSTFFDSYDGYVGFVNALEECMDLIDVRTQEKKT